MVALKVSLVAEYTAGHHHGYDRNDAYHGNQTRYYTHGRRESIDRSAASEARRCCRLISFVYDVSKLSRV